ncbi:peptidase [Anaerocolumna cellulosilytica]|uniref:Peptidase n=1 Tax=Anaerocolumna cellulosilytica TaxID=433286 RepID=A0A6S6QVL8_9FIRM|nr:dipeptidase [Anaerocolumna cellulosilytica]MBB5195976.1 membrane dipeptidase [Anaerocolumna cellulosilytica]BCJ93726.1 peptidase [Anaerocolumna cellulosilytica]
MKVADMHCDTITALYNTVVKGEISNLNRNTYHIDIEKMQKGDYLLQNFAIFVDLKGQEHPLEYCLKAIDFYYGQLELYKDTLAPVFTYEDIRRNKEAGKISTLLTIEEGGVTKSSLEHLRNFYRLGVRMLTLTWNYENGIGHPNFTRTEDQKPDFYTSQTEKGLTDFGLKMIWEMEQLGMIIDVSHLSDAGFYQVLENTTKPFVASHSNARNVCRHVRNLTDDMIVKLAERGGITGMNFCPSFLQEVKQEEEAVGTIASLVENIKHIANVGGYECIGLGSDFDGIPSHKELPDASYLPLLEEALKREGFQNHEIEAIFYKNVLRVYKEILSR